MDRGGFLKGALFGVGGLLTWLIAACDRQSSSTSCTTGTGQVAYTNPGHSHSVINLSAAQVTAGTAGSYTLMGGSHSHAFSLTETDFANLRAGQTLSKQDADGDGHIITIAVC